ncbi:glutamine-dependent NAD(+) synthetase [Hyphomonas johnsonii MHS-2]|uniref:Glutamine-dependent NAD(+) synthetase n=2 Tax=Hyphomonas johnsonii TaxID=81031 RepID=A0A059FEB0_9PROT|nr:NAD+ synthase [Hyphomonas johnsonii]KCZ88886.1 glutamine-dependent NAD(+) synthetase [Hyphomonas johnsonii MHS-2]
MLNMSKDLKILAAQLNPVVGDIKGNLALARQAYVEAREAGADLLVLSELFILGYPAEDLVLKPSAVELSMAAVELLGEETAGGPAVLIGSPWAADGKLHNACVLLQDGQIAGRYDKRELPNYGVFDEKRIFDPGTGEMPVFTFNGIRVGVAICEDIWFPRVPSALHEAGAEMLIVPNGSPWRRAVQTERHTTFSAWRKTGVPYLFVNQVGGQDELVFDGSSYAVDHDGTEHQLMGDFETGTALVTYDAKTHRFSSDAVATLTTGWEAEYRAAVLALGDYVNKNRFPGVVLGMSGGIDSALTAAMAVDALGAERVWCVMMPSKYTSSDSLDDAKACAKMLGCRYDIINIRPGVDALDEMLSEQFARTQPDTTEENIQSRLRAVTLMALSNKFGHMVVTTGNKSEMAVGYATLYGDMCGGYNALKDFYKTEVFELAKWRNTAIPRGALGPGGEVIPERIITKPPSAELREDQRDDDNLPPYEVLDDILRGLVDQEEDVDDIVARGHDATIVRRIEHLLYIAEYKRRQAPPGVKVGGKNFGRDRRYPITNRFRDD